MWTPGVQQAACICLSCCKYEVVLKLFFSPKNYITKEDITCKIVQLVQETKAIKLRLTPS